MNSFRSVRSAAARGMCSGQLRRMRGIAADFLGEEKPGHRWKEARYGAGERTKSHRQRPPAVLTAEDCVDAGEQQIELG